MDDRNSLKFLRALPLGLLLVWTGCGSGEGSEPEPHDQQAKTVIVAPEQQGVVEFDVLSASRVAGIYNYRDVTLHFESEVRDVGANVILELRGMTLTGIIDSEGAFDLDGFLTATGEDTQMTEVDTAVIHTFEVALTDIYRARGKELPALEQLNRSVTIWGDYPSEFPLKRTFFARNDRSAFEFLCDKVNRPGQQSSYSPKYTWSSHDCLTVKNAFAADCAAWSAGCSYGDDSATVENVFMSMHPEGSCSDTTYFGTSATTFKCVEPDHLNNWEFTYGSCMGRCGGTCGGGTQFTGACLDHDVCVSFGHINTTPECLDEFSDAATDFQVAPNCEGTTFTVDYNWAGSANEGACDQSWNGSRDGCDVGCQFIDPDCFF